MDALHGKYSILRMLKRFSCTWETGLNTLNTLQSTIVINDDGETVLIYYVFNTRAICCEPVLINK